jgi:hypothetical protein
MSMIQKMSNNINILKNINTFFFFFFFFFNCLAEEKKVSTFHVLLPLIYFFTTYIFVKILLSLYVH